MELKLKAFKPSIGSFHMNSKFSNAFCFNNFILGELIMFKKHRNVDTYSCWCNVLS